MEAAEAAPDTYRGPSGEQTERVAERPYTRLPSDAADIVQVIIFRLGEEEFAADINQVREVVSKGLVTAMPDSPDFVRGVTSVRGEIAVVIDLKARFSAISGQGIESKHVVITEQDNHLFGLMVDEVTDVLRIPETEIKPAPKPLTGLENVQVNGVINIGNRLILLLDLTNVLSAESLAELARIRLKYEQVPDQRPETEEKEPAPEADAEEPTKSAEISEAEPSETT
ncbi:MAG: hypothetical protein AMS16_00470 [Planctomycetes bacterium DG_58]|nr:MAG: hypothetical protein AMS16_00470 [Planctomycetes bacterium DG_58]